MRASLQSGCAVLLIGCLVAKILDRIITKGLQKAELDQRLRADPGGRFVEQASPGGRRARMVGGGMSW